MKYIDAEKLIERLEEIKQAEYKNCGGVNAKTGALYEVQNLIESLQQEQPLEGKQVIIIAETDGDANIHWDCRSLDDVKALLASAKSFIADKQVEELRGIGSGPDYNTTEGRFRNAHKFQQEQPEVDLEKLGGIARHLIAVKDHEEDMRLDEGEWLLLERIGYPERFNARKEETK